MEGVVSLNSDIALPQPDCLPGRVKGPTRRSSKGGWTEEEDKMLTFAAQKFHRKNWRKIAECVSDRKMVQCMHRWQKALNPDIVNRPWRKEEDELLIELVGKMGQKWSTIAKSLPGRIGKQCRERWFNHLDPDIKRTAWTKEEELTVFSADEVYGSNWSEIARFFHGRTSINSYWHNSLKKKLESYSACGSYVSNYDGKYESRIADEKKQISEIQRGLNAWSMDLIVGNANGRASSLAATDDMLLRKEVNDKVKPITGTVFDSLSNERCNASADSSSGDSNYIIPNPPDISSDNSFSGSPNFLFCERTHQHSGCANSLPSTTSSGPLRPSCSTPFNVGGPTLRNDEIVEKCKDPGSPKNLKECDYGRLRYIPLQLKDLEIFIESGRFPSTETYVKTPPCLIPPLTPPSYSKVNYDDYSCPESILRWAAMTYKNPPSIIRKRNP